MLSRIVLSGIRESLASGIMKSHPEKAAEGIFFSEIEVMIMSEGTVIPVTQLMYVLLRVLMNEIICSAVDFS